MAWILGIESRCLNFMCWEWNYMIVNSSNTLIDLHFPKIQKIVISKYCVDIN